MRKTLLMAICLLFMLEGQSQTYEPTQDNLKAREEFQDAKFGIFLHWGLYSLMASEEWVMNNRNINYKEYETLAKTFYPSQFDAEEWVKTIKDAGAKYITITTRHHDGFSLFKTETSDYNSVDGTPFARDIIKELAEACQKHGIKLHLYYSHLDWHREDYPLGRTGLRVGRPTDKQDYNSYFNFMNTQLTELLTNYGEIGAIWFDGKWDHKSNFDWRLPEQYRLIHSLQPACLIGNNHHESPIEGEDFQLFERDLPGENTAGLSGQEIGYLPLESCQTINDHWGYSIVDNNYKSSKDLIQMLVRAAGKNANLLLNLGPEPSGKLPHSGVDRLKEIGEWLKINGNTIYGTRAGLVAPHPWGVSTQRDNTLYLHILDLQDPSLFVPLAGEKVKEVKSFASGEKLKWVKSVDGITLSLGQVPTEIDYIVEITLK